MSVETQRSNQKTADMNNELVKVDSEKDIGLICLTKPPVNALGVALRTAIHAALQMLLDDANIKAIVLYGEGRFFSAGADIKDFDRGAEKPTLPEVLKLINNSDKPVVAAMHGIAFGGALELALAAQVRVGTSGLKVGLPEVTLGLLPGAGGTQRLPRLTGIEAAVNVICTGKPLTADEALKIGILDRLENNPPREAGLNAARDCLDGKLAATVTDSLSVKPAPDIIETARDKYASGLNAPLQAIDAIEASSLPIDEGLAQERALFMELMHGEERAGLVHAFFAERAVLKIPEQNAERRSIKNIGIVGGGTMGVGIASAFLVAGFRLTLIELQQDRAEQAHIAIKANLSGALKRGKLSEEGYQQALASLQVKTELNDLDQVDLVIEAVFEEMDVKTELFQKLDKICKPGAILATNTSYLDVNQIAAATSRPQDVIGLHFFSPAHIMRLLEVVVADKTTPEIVATSFNLAKQLNKIPVRAGVCDGFIGNRILTKYRKCTEYLLLDGAEFEQIDRALEKFGFALGPFSVYDLAGLDIGRASRLRKAPDRPAEERYSRVSDLICDEGWFGRKTGQGYYLYGDSKQRLANPGAQKIVDAERSALGIQPKSFTDTEIVDRCITAMIIEATSVLQSGIALRPVDIDAVKLFGYGFPRHRGGPLHTADQIGIESVIERVNAYATEDPYFWQVPALLHEMHQKKQNFKDLNTIAEENMS